MGILRNGILGGFSNKTGPLIGVKNGKTNIIRCLPAKSKKPPTNLQLDQRFKFGMVSILLCDIAELINPGFLTRQESSKPMQAAIAYHLKHAITGISPDFAFDFAKLCFSRGNWGAPIKPALEVVAGQIIEFLWYKETKESYKRNPDDHCTILIYNQEQHKFHYQMNAAKRGDGFYSLQCPATYIGDHVYAYMSFQSAYTKHMHSPSIFLGQVVLI